MRPSLIASSTRRSVVQAPLAQIDLSDWLFTLSDQDYRACSVAHIAAGATRLPDGRRVSINVEQPGDTLMVQHYVEETAARDLCRVVSRTDAFTPLGRTLWQVTWQVSLRGLGANAAEFTNHFEVEATGDFLALLESHGLALGQVAPAAQQKADEHNAEETPLFAADIGRKARQGRWPPARV